MDDIQFVSLCTQGRSSTFVFVSFWIKLNTYHCVHLDEPQRVFSDPVGVEEVQFVLLSKQLTKHTLDQIE